MSAVRQWLESLGLGQYADAFEENAVEWDLLEKLSGEELKEIGVGPLGHRKRILEAATTLDAGSAPAQPPAAPTGGAERRQLTVMFCDLVGSVELGEQMDVEDYRDVLGRFRNAVVSAVERSEGFVARHQGDGLLVYFGYPHAHEDDAERAVRAGLDIVQSVKDLEHPYEVTVAVRVGIATGPAVVGDLLETGGSNELAALGQTPNLAARLQGEAEPNSVVISATTEALTAGLFEFEMLSARALKGIADAVTPYRVQAEVRGQSRFAARSGIHLSPFVGREEELELLTRRWSRVQSGRGQVVLTIGEAGIGKSRLLRQLREHIGAEQHRIIALQCSPYHENSALYPSIAAFEHVLGFATISGEEERLQALRHLLQEMALTDEETLVLLAHLLSIPTESKYPAVAAMDATRRRERTLRALVAYVRKLAEQAPLLCAFEDVHWADPSTRELLGRLVEEMEGESVLLIATTRPGFEAQWTNLAHVQVQSLSRLGLQDGAQLARAIAAELTATADDFVQTVLSRAEGNPLFIEELTRTVVQSAKSLNTQHIVPATLQDSLMARLDASQAGKAVAQCAAVIGRAFDHRLLSAVWQGPPGELSAGLDALEQSALISHRGEGETAQYLFKHALIRDTAYGSLLREARANLHTRVAMALEAHTPDIREIQPELLARHYTEASLSEKAVDLWLTAARRASSRSANAETIAHLEAAQALIESSPESGERKALELELRLLLGPALMNTQGSAAAEVGKTYRQALELSSDIGALEQKFTATWGLWLHHEVRGEVETARRRADEVVEIGRNLPDSTYLLQGHHAAWTTDSYFGNHSKSLYHANQGIALYNIDRHRHSRTVYGDHDAGVCAFVHRAYESWFLGYPDQAVVAAEESLTLAETLDHPLSMALARTSAAMIHQLRRDSQAVLRQTESLMAISMEYGLSVWQMNAEILQGWARGALGDQSGLDMMGTALAARAASGSKMRHAYYLAVYAELLGEAGCIEIALDTVGQARSMLTQAGERRWDPLVHIVHGDLARCQSDDLRAESSFELGIETARQHEAMTYQLAAALRLGQLWYEQDKPRDAQALLAPIYEWFTEGFGLPDFQQAKSLLDKLS